MTNKVTDYLIIGAGPGGLQLGYFLEKTGRDYLILEAGKSPGTFFKKYPRHRKLLSINKVHTGYDDAQLNLRWDWNSLLNEDEMCFKDYSQHFFPDADDLVRYLEDFAGRCDLNILYGKETVRISKQSDRFQVRVSDGSTYEGQKLIVATGLQKLYIPRIPGIELIEKYDAFPIEPESFTNKRVLIIGKGNSGFETAESLIEKAASIHLTSPSNLKLAWKSHHVGHLRAVNNNFLDTYLLKTQNGLLEARIQMIEKRGDGKLEVEFNFNRAHGAKGVYVYDRVILCTGFRFDDSIFEEGCKPALALDDRFPEQTSEWESANIKNMYFAGTLMQMRDFKKTQSSFIHGFRYNIRALHQILEAKHHDRPCHSKPVAMDTESIVSLILERINRGAALWHQPGFLCDLLAIGGHGRDGAYYSALPLDYVHEKMVDEIPEYYQITLEYGPDDPDFPFDFERHITAENAHLNPQLHPIIRRFMDGKLVAEHHILEELEGKWTDDIYIQPLREFLGEQMSSLEPAPRV